MAAYLIVNIAAVHDDAAYARYRAQVSAGLEAAGGRYLARGGALQVLEGGWAPGRLVVVEFPSAAAAQSWWASAEYEALRALRQAATTSEMVLVEGVTGEETR